MIQICSDPNNMNSIVYHLIIVSYSMKTLHWYFPWATASHLCNMTGRGGKLQQLHCYHPFSELLGHIPNQKSLWELFTQDGTDSQNLGAWLMDYLARYVKLQVAHAPGMPGTFSPPPRVSDPDMQHGTCVTHVPWCMPGSLTSGFLWSWWQGKRSRHSRRMRSPKFYVSGKRPM